MNDVLRVKITVNCIVCVKEFYKMDYTYAQYNLSNLVCRIINIL
jgi:hypothetical protein